MEKSYGKGADNHGFSHEENGKNRDPENKDNTESMDHYDKDISKNNNETSKFLGREDDIYFEKLSSNDKIVIKNDVENKDNLQSEEERDWKYQNSISINIKEDKVDVASHINEVIQKQNEYWEIVGIIEQHSEMKTSHEHSNMENDFENESITDENYNSLTILTPNIKPSFDSEIGKLVSAKLNLLLKQKILILWLSITLSGLLLSLYMVRLFSFTFQF